MKELQSLLDCARSQHDSLQRQVGDQSAELDALRGSVKSSRVQLATSQQELDQIKAELRTQSGSFQEMQAEREMAQAEVGPVNFTLMVVSQIWQDCVPSGYKPYALLRYVHVPLRNMFSGKTRLRTYNCLNNDKLVSIPLQRGTTLLYWSVVYSDATIMFNGATPLCSQSVYLSVASCMMWTHALESRSGTICCQCCFCKFLPAFVPITYINLHEHTQHTQQGTIHSFLQTRTPFSHPQAGRAAN